LKIATILNTLEYIAIWQINANITITPRWLETWIEISRIFTESIKDLANNVTKKYKIMSVYLLVIVGV